jgi:cyclohexa-1,5-dienecarbonyl-CoA hydratase
MNAYQDIRLTVDDRVATIMLARPPLNVLNIAMMMEIQDALEQCLQYRDLVAIVFDSAAEVRGFSAGVAVEEHEPATIYRMLDSFHGIFRQLEQLARPTIALVDGAALGGGCELVAACDIVVATERARFGQPEIKLGVFPPVAAILLPKVIGEKRARELILTGDLIEAAEALKLGLVNYVVHAEELTQKCLEILSKLRELSAVTLELTRKALDVSKGYNFNALLKDVENIYLHELMKTEDANEGVAAFLGKRKPVWRNR